MPDAAAPARATNLPLVIACLCEIRDASGRLLLLERSKEPNRGLFSPVGGKLEASLGESPAMCARREVLEETGLDIPEHRLRLCGIVSERAYLGSANWLMFWFRATGACELEAHDMDEGRLDWHEASALERLPLPETDRRVIWPLVRANEHTHFSVHIDCSGPDMTWRVEAGNDPWGDGAARP